MNRAERRRKKKTSRKKIKNARAISSKSISSKQSTLEIQQTIKLAIKAHSAGDLVKAKSLYQQILRIDANQPDALHFLGVIAYYLGENEDAVDLIRKAIAISPHYADAHNSLANALKNLHRLDDAVVSYRMALALNPNYAEAHRNLGNTLNDLNQFADAVVSFQNAIAIQPDSAAAHNNLANALRGLNKLDDAIVSYRNALDINPELAEAHNNLGTTLKDLNQLDDAVTSYRNAVAIMPDNAEMHNNLGITLQKLNNLDDALDSYRKALAFRPDYADVLNNIGNALLLKGDINESFNCYRQAIALNPKVDRYWAGLAAALETISFTTIDDNLWQDLLRLIKHSTVNLFFVVRPIIGALRLHPEFADILKLTGPGQPGTGNAHVEAAECLSAIPLFLSLMELIPIDDLEIERLLTLLRNVQLQDVITGKPAQIRLPFSAALAIQCFTNEYVFNETDEETVNVEWLQQRIAILLEQNQELPPSFVVALAAYRPLYRFAWAQKLANIEWPPEIKQVIECQISEPFIEHALKPQIPCLTSIDNTVSQSVREQYEINPYPRWIKTSPAYKSKSIGDVMREAPHNFEIGNYISPEAPEILVAGCGTGRHAISTSSRFLNSHVLAIDLSLSSLSYALRKTRELGLSNIKYAQADIMELGKLGRTFDLIESTGVLHHLGNPQAGWQILVNLLRPGGLMKIGLYSEIARKHIVSGRSMIAEKGYETTPKDIRLCRQNIIKVSEAGNKMMEKVCNTRDFFNLSNFRDLLFHVQEHRFSLLQIEEALNALNLKFLGFEMRHTVPPEKLETFSPKKNSPTILSQWNLFEHNNPDTFIGMYQFWCKKI